MRVDNDTYVWGVLKIVLERKTDANGENPRTQIRLTGADGEEANASLTVWGERVDGRFDKLTTPTIAVIENGVEHEFNFAEAAK